jgi:predicted NAD/FAD-binding protein
VLHDVSAESVVIAAHSDQALAMLADADAREREVLGQSPTSRTSYPAYGRADAAAPPPGMGELEQW